MLEKDYRPADIQFEVANSSIVPDNLGIFKDYNEVVKFVNENLVAVNQRLTVTRFIDNYEKQELRKINNDLLENKLPFLENDLLKAKQELEIAKKKVKELTEQVEGTITEVKLRGVEIKIGTKDISVDEEFTWRIAFENKYYFYTFIDNHLKLCKISTIPDSEKSEIFNQIEKNTDFFKTNFSE